MIVVGELSLWIALLMTAWSATLSFAGGHGRRTDLIRSGERATYAAAGFTALAAIGLWTALLSREFSLRYVASQISANMPNVYVFSAFWSGQAGSMLFWALILAGFSALTVWSNRRRHRDLVPWITGTLAALLLFFLATTAFRANPYVRLDWVPPDGRGMNPQLQNPGMALHPPMLYLGLVATSIPFAFAMAALATRRLDAEWVSAVRRWSLVSWLFLTVGIVVGMWWAYVELGWGGYWAWDPVQNSALLPWLTGTAFLHSLVLQEKRGVLRRWNVTLVAVTFLLSVLGTFITRGGIIESVHSFARGGMAGWLGTFLAAASAITAYLLATRLKDLDGSGGLPEVQPGLESVVSREAALLVNNLLLLGIAFSVLWGTLFPVLSEWVRGTTVTVGPPFFNTLIVPLGLVLLALMGIGLLMAWRKSSLGNLRRQLVWPVIAGVAVAAALRAAGMRNGHALVAYLLVAFVAATIAQEFWSGVAARRSAHRETFHTALGRLVARHRRRYGGYIAHAGMVMLFAAFAGQPFRAEHDVSLAPGQLFEVTDPFGRRWRFVSQGISASQSLNRDVTSVVLEAWRDGKNMGLIRSERRQYFDAVGRPTFQPSTEAGIRTDPRLDTYVVLAGVRDEAAEIRISFNPLVLWVWLGGALLALGGLIVMWPRAHRPGQADPVATLRPAAEPDPLVAA